MSTPAGAVAPFQGAVSGQVVDRKSEITHEFLNIIRKVIRDSNIYRHENDLHEALRTVDSYSRAVLASDHIRVQKETDAAPVEDVRLRKAPGGALPTVPGPQIDYRALAEAMFAVQQAHAQEAQQPERVYPITGQPDNQS